MHYKNPREIKALGFFFVQYRAMQYIGNAPGLGAFLGAQDEITPLCKGNAPK